MGRLDLVALTQGVLIGLCEHLEPIVKHSLLQIIKELFKGVPIFLKEISKIDVHTQERSRSFTSCCK